MPDQGLVAWLDSVLGAARYLSALDDHDHYANTAIRLSYLRPDGVWSGGVDEVVRE
jgi:hypothetical protein